MLLIQICQPNAPHSKFNQIKYICSWPQLDLLQFKKKISSFDNTQCRTQQYLPHVRAWLKYFHENHQYASYQVHAQKQQEKFKRWSQSTALCNKCQDQIKAQIRNLCFYLQTLNYWIAGEKKNGIEIAAEKLGEIFSIFQHICGDQRKTVQLQVEGEEKSQVQEEKKEKKQESGSEKKQKQKGVPQIIDIDEN